MALNKSKILIVEDNPGDYLLIEEYLKDEFPEIKLTNVQTYSKARKILKSQHDFDIILLDLSLPDITNMTTLVTKMVLLAENIPLIILTGYGDKAFSLKLLSKGVSDYLQKDGLSSFLLVKSIQYSIERKVSCVWKNLKKNIAVCLIPARCQCRCWTGKR